MKKLVLLSLAAMFIFASCSVNVLENEGLADIKSRSVIGQELVSGGMYKITAMCSGKALDVSEWSSAAGANIHQWGYEGGANQQWWIHSEGDGSFVITSNFSGLALDVEAWSTASGANIQQWTVNHYANQKWYFERLNDGCYKITNVYSGKVLDVSNASVENGANVQQWDWNNTDAQHWVLTRLDPYTGEVIGDVSEEPGENNEGTEKEPEVEDDSVVFVNGRNYSLVFKDEFEGSVLDSSKWERCPEWQRQDLGGYWENDCSYLKDGNLVIECRNNNGRLESGAIRSRNRFEQNKGVYKIRFKAEKSSAVWYAFWLMTDAESKVGNGARDGAEIDVFEIIANDPWMPSYQKKYLNSAVHWDGYGSNMKSASSQHFVDDSFFEQWHEATFVWTDAGYTLYLDGMDNAIWVADGKDYGGTCETANYIKITAEFGTWGGPVNNNLLPAHFYVDWVKVYN